MIFKFRDWFFRQFPEWHQENDVNKDAAGEGTWQRYLRGFGQELDEEIMIYLEGWLDIIDLVKTDTKYLPMIAGILGTPPGYMNNNDIYRRILAHAVAIYKIKGTKCAYKLFLGILGFTVKFIEAKPKKKYQYDLPITYDNDPIYDSSCEYCSCFWLSVADRNNTTTPLIINPLSQAQLDAITNIICFLTPINAKFCGFTPSANFGDIVSPGIRETILFDGNPAPPLTPGGGGGGGGTPPNLKAIQQRPGLTNILTNNNNTIDAQP